MSSPALSPLAPWPDVRWSYPSSGSVRVQDSASYDQDVTAGGNLASPLVKTEHSVVADVEHATAEAKEGSPEGLEGRAEGSGTEAEQHAGEPTSPLSSLGSKDVGALDAAPVAPEEEDGLASAERRGVGGEVEKVNGTAVEVEKVKGTMAEVEKVNETVVEGEKVNGTVVGVVLEEREVGTSKAISPESTARLDPPVMDVALNATEVERLGDEVGEVGEE